MAKNLTMHSGQNLITGVGNLENISTPAGETTNLIMPPPRSGNTSYSQILMEINIDIYKSTFAYYSDLRHINLIT